MIPKVSSRSATSFLAKFEQNAEAFAGNPALWCRGKFISYAELLDNARVIQARIQRMGVKPGLPIAIHAHDRELAITAIIAILRHGSPYLPLDPLYPADRLDYMVNHAQVALTISDNDDFRSTVGDHLDLGELSFSGSSDVDAGKANITPDSSAYVIYTSGSTGTPKGVLMNHGTLDNLIAWQNERYEPEARYRTLQFSAFSFDVSFQETFSTLAMGGTLYLIEDTTKQDFRRLLEFIDEHRIERIFLPYIALLQLVMWANRLKLYPSSLKEVITAGEQLVISKELRTAFSGLENAMLCNQYGPCETHVVSEYQLHQPTDNWPALPPIGLPITSAELLVLDDHQQPVTPGDVGELYIAGPVLADGYINSPEQTAERFIELQGPEPRRAYRTGDLVSVNSNGEYAYHGRMDNQVKIRGYRIELSEVEVRLLDTGLVSEAAAAVQQVGEQKRLIAFVTEAERGQISDDAIRKQLKSHMPDYMVPSRFIWVDALLKTPSGKIDRKSMLESLEPTTEQRTETTSSEVLSEQLMSIIRDELNHPGLMKDQNLQDQGMDSLAANRIAASFLEKAGLSVPVYSLFQHRTAGHFLRYATSRYKAVQSGESQANNAPSRDESLRDVAIIGLSARVPGANSIEQFWQNLLDGKETVTFFEPENPSTNQVNARGVLDDPLGFDARFFGITPIEAEFVDPQQRLLLELAWHALENAGVDPEKFAGKIGVFCGVGNNTYYLNNVLKNHEKLEDYGPLQAMVANEKDYAATRLAHKLNLVGPALSIHTACSTSLVAVAEAVEAIRHGRCDIAIAGGASVAFPQQQPHTHEEGSIYTRDGHTRPFDANSSGTVFSDGGGMVVLKRLDEALKDRDYVYAAITGIGVNNDGAEKGSFSGPSVEGQKSVILSAIKDARQTVSEIGYVEAHGTATPIGDPIEVTALSSAFSQFTPDRQFCKLGSVKSNFGHLTAAAGVVGLIKSALAIDRGVIPPSINFETPNPELALEQTPFVVAATSSPWEAEKEKRIAGVSSFGIGGTNAHVLLKGVQADATDTFGATPNWVPLCFSAHSAEALSALISSHRGLLEECSSAAARADLVSALIRSRRAFPFRETVLQTVGNEALNNVSENAADNDPAFGEPTIVFAFPGQGCQVAGMGRRLYEHVPVFREGIDHCDDILKQEYNVDIKELLFHSGDPLKDTQKTQIALFCVGFGLAKVLNRLGVQPAAGIGHSIGELVAATVAGVFDLPTALRVVLTRGEVMQAQQPGSMMAVRADIDELTPLLPAGVVIAAENTEGSVTLSGESEAVKAFGKILGQQGIKFRELNTSHAFHSPSMDGASKAFAERLENIELHSPRFRFISCVSGDWITDDQATDIRYWARQIRQPVQFRKGCQTLGELNQLVVLECGPQGTVCGMAMQNLAEKSDVVFVPLVAEAGDDEKELASFSTGLGKAWCAGVDVDWPCGEFPPSLRSSLPQYPFQHKTFVIEPLAEAAVPGPSESYSPTQPDFAAAIPDSPSLTGQNMNDAIKEQLRTLFSDISGIDLSQADGEATFFELGLDSLLLTQSTLKLKKKFKVNLTFRQLLNDCGNLDKLTEYLIKEGVTAGTPQATPAPQASRSRQQGGALPGTPPGQIPPGIMNTPQPAMAQAPSGDIQALLQQQMQIMQGQLAVLSSLASQGPLPVTPASSDSGKVSQTRSSHEGLKPFGAGTRINVKRSNDMTPVQKQNFDHLSERYNQRFARSKQFAQDNRKQLADPRVVSGFRTVIKEVIYPIVVERSEGPYLWDIDGGKLIDVTCGFGSNFFGNSAAFIKEAIARQLDTGYEIGPQHPLVAEASRLFCQVTGNERVAFCNTGSEAVLGAMRLARTVTAKEKVVLFENDYHGIHDDVIVTRGSNGYAVPAAAGIPDSAVENMIVLDYGSDESLDYIREHADEIAAILVEPVQSRHPSLQPKAFLEKARTLCTEQGIALIFDEVITGFRIHARGAQGYYGIDADICTYGKIVGGGLPIGAISGKAGFMDALDGGQWQFGDDSSPEVGVTYFAGTFVRHPLVLSAAVAVLRRLVEEPELQSILNDRADRMVEEINQYARMIGAPLKIENCGSMCKIKIPQDIAFEELIYILLREKGIHVWDARPMFITTAHTEEDIQSIIQAFKDAMDDMIAMEFFPVTEDPTKVSKTESQKPPVEGARLGRDENGKAAWFVPSRTNKNQFEKWAG
ncbi:amino acid adenylation domain-containing protein [Marinobacter sp. chi1]|uniref:Amino acid adenylation domain-containing protein n=1 Tax=Marinobacter suaedae TaxID=3057675 RepID=A0ABT8W2E7_9GAMM|nr:polyketide synthase [Marinobacter sp. chi1]MDO3722400.1 amino acid adenylation domain-containing protein [Marinobacter sp. chi1]